MQTTAHEDLFMQPLEKLYSEKEVATYLGVSIFTIRRARYAGEISFIQSKRCIRYRESHITEYLQSKEITCHEMTDLKSTGTGFQSVKTARNGAQRGSVPKLDRQNALASARQILK
jgi:tRNA(His) 5'-end guanylyltransferase